MMRRCVPITEPRSRRRDARGFTLAEAIIVIVITGILAGVVAVFIRSPVQGFFDTARRAALADIADTAVRRLGRDLRQALPNSVRVSGTAALEFLHVRSAGRYREQGPGGDVLDFTSSTDTSFDVLGPGTDVQAGDLIVVYNLGVPGSDAYEGTSARAAAAPFGSALATVTFDPAGTAFRFSSPGRRFQVVDTPVSYICSGSQMRRYWGYAVTAAQPNPPAGGSSALLADKVTRCDFSYATGASQRDALVSLRLELSDGGETVSLIHQVHVSNAP